MTDAYYQEWFKEWLRLAKREYQGQRIGLWLTYYDGKKLIYKYEEPINPQWLGHDIVE